MLGHDVQAEATAAGHEVVALGHTELDIADEAAVLAALERAAPDCVINCAAFTNVDGAETQADLAHAVNGAGAGNMARAAAGTGAWTIHVSTDYVFDGHKREPYVESDPVSPQSVYGHSKLEGERAVAQAASGAHTIVRSSWLFGAAGPCFPATILRLAEERDSLSVVDDQVGCPTFTRHLAGALVLLAGERRLGGIVHVAGGGHCSWFEFAREIVARAGLACDVQPGVTADLGRPAPRPAYSVLGTERGGEVPRLPAWQEGLAEFMTATVAS